MKKSLSNPIYLLAFTVLFNCNSKKTTLHEGLKVIDSEVSIKIDHLDLDTLYFSRNLGAIDFFIKMNQDKIYFFDKNTSKVFIYDLNGNFLEEHLGFGRGPGEVTKVYDYLYYNNKHVVIGGTDINIFNRNWQIEQRIKCTFPITHPIAELKNSPDPSYIDIYEIQYYENEFAVYDSNSLIFNVEATHPKFSAFNTASYYRNSRIFGIYNMDKEKVTEILGRKTRVYEKYSFIPNHDFHYYDLVNDTIFLNFEPDSLIYVYDKNMGPLYAFGKPGFQMNMDYNETRDKEVINDRNKFILDRITEGYYYHIKYFSANNILFRTYTLGLDKKYINQVNDLSENPKRMQVYKGTRLIGDVSVPAKFRIIGYKEPFYYADGYYNYSAPDNKPERPGLYKFKLKPV